MSFPKRLEEKTFMTESFESLATTPPLSFAYKTELLNFIKRNFK